MPLFAITRFALSFVSLVIWGIAGYLIWSWFDGQAVIDAAGQRSVEREDWRLWVGVVLLAWSLLGRFILLPLLARRSDRREGFERGQGDLISMDDGSCVYVEHRGETNAPAIVFTHGQGLDSTVWTRARRTLGEFHVVTWDLPGLGRSTPAAGQDYSVPAAASALREVVKQTSNGRPVVLVGHSFGGMAIQELAKLDPDFFRRNIEGVVLLHTTYTNPLHTMVFSKLALALQKPVLEPLMRLSIFLEPLVWLNLWQSYFSGAAHLANRMQFGPSVTREQLEHTTLLATKNRPGAMDRRNLAMFRWDGLMPETIDVPVLVVGGTIDIVTKAEASTHISHALRTATLQLAPHANHLGPIEMADKYNNVIAEFAQSLAGADPHTPEDAELMMPPGVDTTPQNGQRPYLH